MRGCCRKMPCKRTFRLSENLRRLVSVRLQVTPSITTEEPNCNGYRKEMGRPRRPDEIESEYYTCPSPSLNENNNLLPTPLFRLCSCLRPEEGPQERRILNCGAMSDNKRGSYCTWFVPPCFPVPSLSCIPASCIFE